MAIIENDASLRGKIRAVASKSGLRAQEVLQMYLFEHLLLRLERSSYSNTIVLKGRLLISSMIGLARRTIMDMDTAVVGMPMVRKSVERAITEIYTICVDDGMDRFRYGDRSVIGIWKAHLHQGKHLSLKTCDTPTLDVAPAFH